MSFWDASALVPLVLPEALSPLAQRAADADNNICVWWGTIVECHSAIQRRLRIRELSQAASSHAEAKLAEARSNWQETEPSERIRDQAIRYMRRHPLSAADALQLAAAYALAEGDPPSLDFVSLDSLLVEAARRERFRITDLAAGGQQ